jgi:hypothetical protein
MKYPTDFKRSLANRLPDDVIEIIVSYLVRDKNTKKTFTDNGFSTINGVPAWRDYERSLWFNRDYNYLKNGGKTSIEIIKDVSNLEDDHIAERVMLQAEFARNEKIYKAMNFHTMYQYDALKLMRRKKINDFYEAVRNIHIFLIKVNDYREHNKIATVFLLEQKDEKLNREAVEFNEIYRSVEDKIKWQGVIYTKSGDVNDLMKCVEMREGYEEKKIQMEHSKERNIYQQLITKRAKRGKNLPLWKPLMLIKTDEKKYGFNVYVLGVMTKGIYSNLHLKSLD